MDENEVEIAVERIDRLLVASGLGALLQYVTDGGDDARPRLRLNGCVEQRQQFEPHLAAAERKGLDDKDVGRERMEDFQKAVAAHGLECLAGRLVGRCHEAGKAFVA